MGLFSGNHNIYKDGEKGSKGKIKNPKGGDCGTCHGDGKKHNRSGRPIGGKCPTCKGSGSKY